MDTVTYKDVSAIQFINNHLIAMRINTGSAPYWAQKYPIQYTPTIIIVDDDGKEHHRIVGFIPPRDFTAFLLLGMAKADYEIGNIKKSKERLDNVIQQYPNTEFAEQARKIRSSIP